MSAPSPTAAQIRSLPKAVLHDHLDGGLRPSTVRAYERGWRLRVQPWLGHKKLEKIINKYGFYYFHVATKPGYYEGFSLDIEFNFPAFFDNWNERAEAQKEVTALKKCLVELAGIGLVSCRPGWVTGYDDYSGTLQQIKAAIEAMRADVAETPTYRQYCA